VFWEKWVFERGFLMVKSWWMCGESWLVDDRFLTPKNTPLFSTLFLMSGHQD
jgi:hypothetical protein